MNEELDLLREQARKIENSGALGRSRSYARLLEFLIDASQAGRVPKELEIAMERVRQGRRLRSEPGLDGAGLRAQPSPEARALLRDRRPGRAAAAHARARRVPRLVVAPSSRAASAAARRFARDSAARCRRRRRSTRAPRRGRRRRAPGSGTAARSRRAARIARPPPRGRVRAARDRRARRILRGRGAPARAFVGAGRRGVADLGRRPRGRYADPRRHRRLLHLRRGR